MIPYTNDFSSGTLLERSRGWLIHRLDNTDARCWSETAVAARFPPGSRIELYIGSGFDPNYQQAFFHNTTVAERVAVLVHEARHIQYGPHRGTGQKDATWAEDGPYRWQAVWLGQFAEDGDQTRTTEDLRCAALASATAIVSQTQFWDTLPPAGVLPAANSCLND